MREIKFRAFVNGKMISWEEMRNSEYFSDFFFMKYLTNPPRPVAKLMQFTGFYDRNEKEIYEGDITFYVADTFDDGPQPFTDVVEFQDGSYCIKSNELYWAVKEIQVIGNIYENPYLINPT